MTPKKTAKKSADAAVSPLVSPLRTLLHTMRCITQHEDRLCTLLHTVQNSPVVSEELQNELLELIEQLPHRDYTDDLDALRSALGNKDASTERETVRA